MKNRLGRIASTLTLLALLCALAPSPVMAEGSAVNLNTATEEELVALPGIGPSKAKAIIDYRTEHPFQNVEELLNVRGIGEHTFATLKDKVRVEMNGSAKR